MFIIFAEILLYQPMFALSFISYYQHYIS